MYTVGSQETMSVTLGLTNGYVSDMKGILVIRNVSVHAFRVLIIVLLLISRRYKQLHYIASGVRMSEGERNERIGKEVVVA